MPDRTYRHRLVDNLSIFITVSDLFNGQRFVRYANATTLDQFYLHTQSGRVVYVGLSWLFGAPKKAKAASFEYEQ